MAWVAARVLPNIEVEEPVDGGLASLVPHADPRLVAICGGQSTFGKLIRGLTDAFGERLSPAVLIVRSDAPAGTFTVEALAGFRDALALSTVPYNRAKALCQPDGNRINFTDSFWLYPWMVDREGEGLVCCTPAMLGDAELRSSMASPRQGFHDTY